MIYLDSAATTLQKPKSVARAAKKAINTLASPGRGGHAASMRAAEVAFECRELATEMFNVADPASVVFTSNATHGLNIAIKSLAKPGDRVLVSGYEHNSVMRPLRYAGAEIVIARSELFEPETAVYEFERRIERDGISFVVMTHMSNVFGYVLPAERIADVCRARGIPFVIDASQSAGVVPIDFEALGAEFVAMPGHKGLYGPQGTGILLAARPVDGIMQGGSGTNSLSERMPALLPDALEAGTHNMPGIAGLYAGLCFVKKTGISKIAEHERRLIIRAERELAGLPRVKIFGGGREMCRGGVLSFQVEGIGCEEIAGELGARKIAVRAGFHCAPEAHKTAGTIADGTIRISVSAFNNAYEIRRFAEILENVISMT